MPISGPGEQKSHVGRPPLKSRYPRWRDTVAHKENKDLAPPLSPTPVSPRALSWPHLSLPPRTLDHVAKVESGAVRADGRRSARTSRVHAGSFPYRHRDDKGGTSHCWGEGIPSVQHSAQLSSQTHLSSVLPIKMDPSPVLSGSS